MIIFASQDELKNVTVVCGEGALSCFLAKDKLTQTHAGIDRVLLTMKNSEYGEISDIRDVNKESPLYFLKFIKQTLSHKGLDYSSQNYKEVLFTLISNLGKEHV